MCAGRGWAWSVEQGEWRGQKNETGDGHPGCLCCPLFPCFGGRRRVSASNKHRMSVEPNTSHDALQVPAP
jgi:hypothetical protein